MLTDSKGSGPVVFLVGGGLTGWLSWIPHQERLAAKRQAIRAQPLSVQYGLDSRRLPVGYSIKTESQSLAASVRPLAEKQPVDVVAWSYGALIALDCALDHPSWIRTLTLIEPPAVWTLAAAGVHDAEAERQIAELRALHEEMRTDVDEAKLARFARAVGLLPPGHAPGDLPQWPLWLAHRQSLRVGDAPFAHSDRAERLRAFERPTLLVKGTGSSRFLHLVIDALGSLLPRARTIELPGGHAPQIAAMDTFLEQLAEFQRATDLR